MTNEKYQIAVIEDNPKHLEDVKKIITPRENLVEAVYATNLEEALALLNSRKFEGILSDAHFPRIAGGLEESSGIDMIDYAMEKRMPITIVTSAYHHGKKTEPISQRARDSGIELIDTYIEGNKEAESPTKKWSCGLATLVFLIDRARTGQLRFATITSMAADGEHLGISSCQGEGNSVYFDLPPYKETALDEIKQRFGFKFDNFGNEETK